MGGVVQFEPAVPQSFAKRVVKCPKCCARVILWLLHEGGRERDTLVYEDIHEDSDVLTAAQSLVSRIPTESGENYTSRTIGQQFSRNGPLSNKTYKVGLPNA